MSAKSKIPNPLQPNFLVHPKNQKANPASSSSLPSHELAKDNARKLRTYPAYWYELIVDDVEAMAASAKRGWPLGREAARCFDLSKLC
jgi:hypothetical protein